MSICRNIKINGRRTSLRLDKDMWDAVHDVARLKGVTPAELVSEVELQRGDASTTAALRVYVLRYYRDALREVMEIESASPPAPVKRPAQAYVTVM